MRVVSHFVFKSAVGLILAGLAVPALALADKIVVGQSVELSGQATGKEGMLGAQLFFNWINTSQGGVNGRKIELITYDDQRDPQKTKDNTLKLIKDDHAVALLGYRSTPTVQAVLPLLEKNKIPLVAPFSGSQSLYKPMHPYVFNLRASYQDEAAKMVESVALMQIKNIAILYQDDAFGKDGLAGFEKHLGARQIKASAIAKYDRKDLNVDAAVTTIMAANPAAILMACTPSACADFIKKVKTAGRLPQFMMLSNVNSEEFFSSLGKLGRGVGVIQVMPAPRNIGVPVVREFQHALKASSNPPPVTSAVLEGFIAAKLLAEGIRRSGANLSPQKLVSALESMNDFDLGGITLQYGSSQHNGSNFVEMSIVDQNGKMMR
ncbi:ABC transporter substrate-binding protein [Undibacterium sp. Ren11W]|uniref:ABC transporter substrate-binding protein n=1 Tax=Undibacterium sp. Ren11W TaxID=3413045 RepID=UPI003BF09C5B